MQENKDREEFTKKLGVVAKGIINMAKERQDEEKKNKKNETEIEKY